MIHPKDYDHKLFEMAIEGKSGDWSITKTVDEPDSEAQTNCYDWERGEYYQDYCPDKFPVVNLSDVEGRMMSNGPCESDSYIPSINKALGEVLSVGLGIGLLPVMLWDKLGKEIIRMDILELEPDVIKLVSQYIKHPNISIIQGDAWKYPRETTKKYDFIFLDFWAPTMQAITEGPVASNSYRKLLKPGGQVRFWLQELQEKLKSDRGTGNNDKEELQCSACGKTGISSFVPGYYGYLCTDCAREYESYLYKDTETHANGNLSETLRSLGYKSFTEVTLSETTRADVVAESNGSKYLIECKNNLTASTYKDLIQKVVAYSEFKPLYTGLKILMHGNINPGLASKLGAFIESQKLTGWAEIIFGGELV